MANVALDTVFDAGQYEFFDGGPCLAMDMNSPYIDLLLTKKNLNMVDVDIELYNLTKSLKEAGIPIWYSEQDEPPAVLTRDLMRSFIKRIIQQAGTVTNLLPLRILPSMNSPHANYTIKGIRIITDDFIFTPYLRRYDLYFLAFNFWDLKYDDTHTFWHKKWVRLSSKTNTLEEMEQVQNEIVDPNITFGVQVGYKNLSSSLELGKFSLQRGLETIARFSRLLHSEAVLSKVWSQVSESDRESAKDVICFCICEAARRKHVFKPIFEEFTSGHIIDRDMIRLAKSWESDAKKVHGGDHGPAGDPYYGLTLIKAQR